MISTAYRDIVGPTHVLSQQEEVVVYERLRHGTDTERQTAIDQLFRSMFRLLLIKSWAFARARRIKDRDDVEAWATMGVLKAIKTWDPGKGRFSTHCELWMRTCMSRGWMEDRLIHVPIPVQERQRHVNPAYLPFADAARRVRSFEPSMEASIDRVISI